jgi:hypothetical protein
VLSASGYDSGNELLHKRCMLNEPTDQDGRDKHRNRAVLEPLSIGIAPAEGCRSCEIVQWVAGQSLVEGSELVGETANEDAVMLSGPQLAGLVVIPRRCVSGLEELPPLGRAHVLAAVRRATLLVRDGDEGPTTRIVATTDSSSPKGHVSFQVLPTKSAHEPTNPALWSLPPR